jgi:hypothetical protein
MQSLLQQKIGPFHALLSAVMAALLMARPATPDEIRGGIHDTSVIYVLASAFGGYKVSMLNVGETRLIYLNSI